MMVSLWCVRSLVQSGASAFPSDVPAFNSNVPVVHSDVCVFRSDIRVFNRAVRIVNSNVRAGLSDVRAVNSDVRVVYSEAREQITIQYWKNSWKCRCWKETWRREATSSFLSKGNQGARPLLVYSRHNKGTFFVKRRRKVGK